MVQTCGKCSRANPKAAVYCYFDGFVLTGQSANGVGPVAVGKKPFANPFVFPGGRQSGNFDELALACQHEWAAACEMLRKGRLENFLVGLGRMDLAQVASEATRFPSPDRGLDQLLAKLPTDVLTEPKLSVEPLELNLGVLSPGTDREFTLHLKNDGMRLLFGSVICSADWLVVGEGGGSNEKHFQFTHELAVAVRARGDRLRANKKPLEAVLDVSSNGGVVQVVVRAEVPIKGFPSGLLAGARSPRQVAEKAMAKPKESAPLFESGAVANWYKANGWIYPVQGPSSSGLGAVQQFFEALGVTKPPKVAVSVSRIDLTGDVGNQLSHSLEVVSEEKKPVYAHATSDRPWLEVGRARLNGRTAVINLSVPSVPDREGETLTAKLTVQSNGKQSFVVPVTLRIGQGLVFGAELVPSFEADAVDAAGPSPLAVAVVSPSVSRHRRHGPSPLHFLPALLLVLTLGTAVALDLLWKPPVVAEAEIGDPEPPPIVAQAKKEPTDPWVYTVKDTDPLLALRPQEDTMRFGLGMTKAVDPRNPDKFKRLTYEELGISNNTIVMIDGYEYYFGEQTPTNVWADMGKARKVLLPNNRHGWTSTMRFTRENVFVTQHVEIVPGQSGYLDTCLIWYNVKNDDNGKRKIGLRVMIDTYIGANDGVPFTVPGRAGFVDTLADFEKKKVPDYIEVIEKPDDTKNPGTVARMGLRHLKLPGVELEDPEMLRICRWPGNRARWKWTPENMVPDDGGSPDSCVVLYWPYEMMNGKDVRNMAFTYGLGELDIGAAPANPASPEAPGAALALSVPAYVQPSQPFVATVYAWRAKKGDTVRLEVPAGLTLEQGETAEKTIAEEGKRTQVFWRLRGGAGKYVLKATSGKAEAKPKEVEVKTASIFG